MRLLLVPFLAASLLAADPGLLRYAPADSTFLLGINVRGLLESPSGSAILTQARSSPELARFIAETGFDPLRDIDEIVVAGAAAQGKNAGSILVRGRFDPTVLALLTNEQFTASDYRGVTVFTRTASQPFSVAQLAPNLVVAGDADRVRHAIRRGPGAGPSPELAAKAAELAPMHIWFAAVVPAEEIASADLPQGVNPALKSIQQASGGVTFGADVVISADLVARTPEDATSIASMVRMFTGLAASANRNAKEAGAILEKLAIRTEGPNVHLGLTIPEAELLRLAQQARERMASARPAQPAAPPPTGVIIQSSPSDMGTVKIE